MAKITVRDNGPFLVDGDDITVCDPSGKEIAVQGRPFALCRCGASDNKPFCDGAHGRIGFQAASTSSE